jgi:predicted metalloprotease with PDZ domain
MLVVHCAVLLAALAAAQTAAAPAQRAQTALAANAPALTYEVRLENPAQHLVRVTMSGFPQLPVSEFQLPVWNALYQVRDFSQYVLRVSASRRSEPVPVTQVDKTTWAALAPDRFQYELFADNAGPFGAQLDPTHAFLNLAEILVYSPELRNASVRVDFCGIPAGWRVATPLAAAPPRGDCRGFSAKNYDELVDSPIEIGTFQQTDFDEGGAHYSVVVHADPADYDAGAVTELARKLAATEVEWMQDRPFDHYVFVYHFPRRPAGGGMEHAYSTAIDVTARRVKDDPQSIASVTAHEFFHLWNVKRIRPQSLEPVDYTREQYSRALWFSEGVTSTVADYMLVRAGLEDEKRFLDGVAGSIRMLESRPAHLAQSAEESSLTTWFDKYPFYGQPERSISYYNKGELLGMLLDLSLRDATGGHKSLRDLFQWMNEHYARQGRFFPDSAGVEQAAEAISGADFKQFFSDYVAGLAPLPYDRLFATVGLRLERRTRTVADAGFRSMRGAVTSVSPGSAAEQAGLRAGDVIQEVQGKPVAGRPDALVGGMRPGDILHLKVSGPAGARELKFALGSREEQDFALVDMENVTPAERARRAAWMRGDSE